MMKYNQMDCPKYLLLGIHVNSVAKYSFNWTRWNLIFLIFGMLMELCSPYYPIHSVVPWLGKFLKIIYMWSNCDLKNPTKIKRFAIGNEAALHIIHFRRNRNIPLYDTAREQYNDNLFSICFSGMINLIYSIPARKCLECYSKYNIIY